MNKFLFTDCVQFNGKLYFYGSLNGMPAKYDFLKNTISYIPDMLIDVLDANDIIERVLLMGNQLIGLSQQGKYAYLYDFGTHKISNIQINADESLWGNYVFITTFENTCYIFTQKKLIKIDSTRSSVSQQKIYESGQKNLVCGCRKDNDVWLFYENGDLFLHYDLIDKSMQKCYMGLSINKVVHTVEYDNCIYILCSDGMIYLLKPQEKYIEAFAKANTSGTMGRIVITDESFIILPALGDSIVIIKRDTKEQCIYNQYPSDFLYLGDSGWSKYFGSCEMNGKIIFGMQSANHILIINKKNGKLQWIKPIIPSVQEEVEYLKDSRRHIVKEMGVTLEAFVQGAQVTRTAVTLHQLTGKRVWDIMKKCYVF